MTALDPAIYTQWYRATVRIPSIYFAAGDKAGQLTTDDNPVVAGDWVSILATGLGPVAPDSAGVMRTVNPVSVEIMGLHFEPAYAGPMPGFPGIYQINLQVPNVLPGWRPARLIEGDFYSNEVTLRIRD